jgi:hypothetical protein
LPNYQSFVLRNPLYMSEASRRGYRITFPNFRQPTESECAVPSGSAECEL